MAHLHREYSVGYSYRGFTLFITDYPIWAWAAGEAVERLLVLLGHPCCFRGFGRIWPIGTLSYRALSASINWQRNYETRVAEVRLTSEQALVLQPSYVEDTGPDGWITIDGEDEDGDVWVDGVLVAVRCAECAQVIDTAGCGSAEVARDHAGQCGGSR